MPISRITGASIEDGSITLADLGITTIDSGTGNTLTLQANSRTGITIDVTGNTAIANTLTFSSSNGGRIRGDFSNATLINRVMFQNSVTNGGTSVGFIPNGTSPSATLNVFNNSDPTNASALNVFATSSEVSLRSIITGSGTYIPLTMYTGGTERLRIDTSGNVGIGTSSPSTRLHLYGALNEILRLEASSASYDAALRIFQNGTQTTNLQGGSGVVGGGTILYTVTNAPLVFGTNNTERMRVSNAGNIGIGTTSPSQLLHVAAGTILSSNTAGTIATVSIAGNGSTVGTSDFALQQGTSSEAYVYNRANSYLVIGTNNTERMRIDSAGRVAIGPIASAGYTVGTLMVGDTTNSGASASIGLFGKRITEDQISSDINFYNNSTTSIAYIYALRGSSDTAAGKLTFGTGGSERMRIDSSGKVGIGITPAAWETNTNSTVLQVRNASFFDYIGAQLDIGLNTYFDGTNYRRITTSSASRASQSGGAHWWSTAASGSGGSTISWTETMRITAGGNITMGSSSVTGDALVINSPMAKVSSSSGWGIIVSDTNTDGAAGRGGAIAFGARRTDGGQFNAGAIGGAKSNSTGLNENGDLALYSSVNSSLTERMRIDSSGRVGIGTTTPASRFHVRQNTGGTDNDNDCVGQFILGDGSTFGSILFVKNAGNRGTRGNPDGSGLLTLAFSNATALNVDKSGNLAFDSGYGSAATAYGCRAWVNFNGSGAVAIRASGNVSSITDNGTGDYTINFTTAMPDANYAILGESQDSFTYLLEAGTGLRATNNCRVYGYLTNNGSAYDITNAMYAVFR